MLVGLFLHRFNEQLTHHWDTFFEAQIDCNRFSQKFIVSILAELFQKRVILCVKPDLFHGVTL